MLRKLNLIKFIFDPRNYLNNCLIWRNSFGLLFVIFIFVSSATKAQDKSREDQITVYFEKGDSLLNLDNYQGARDLYSKAYAFFQSSNRRLNYINYKVGYSYIAEDEGFLALAYFTDILLSFNPQSVCDSALMLLISTESDLLTIEVLSPKYQFDLLLERYAQLQANYSSWENARFQFLIAEIFNKRLDYNNAIKWYKKSLAFKHNDQFLKESTLFEISVAYTGLLDFKNASDMLLYLQNAKTQHLNKADIFFLLGKTNMYNKDYQSAINYFEKSIYKNSSAKNECPLIETYILIGNCYLFLDNEKIAFDMFNKAETLSMKPFIKNKEYIQSLIAKGNYYGYIKDFIGQKQYLYKALNHLEKTGDNIESRSIITEYLTQAYCENNNYEQAIHQVDLFLEKYKSMKLMEVVNSIGWTRYQTLLQNKAMAAYRIWQSDSGNVDKITRAYNYFKDGLNAVSGGFLSMESEESKRMELKRIRQLYSDAFIAGFDLYNLTHDDSLLDELFQLIENSKANLFKINLRYSKAIAFSDIPFEYVKREGLLKKQIAWLKYNLDEKNTKNETSRNIPKLRDELIQVQMSYDSLILVLENNYPQYYSARYNQLHYNLKYIQKRLFTNQSVLDYFLTGNRLFVFLVSVDHISFREIPLDKNFDNTIIQYRELLNPPYLGSNIDDNCHEFGKLSYNLYNTLISPVNINLSGKRLIIIPDREINFIPFQTLVTDTNNLGNKNYSDLDYLLYSNPITTLYSIEQLFTKNKSLNRKSKYLGIAPKYSKGSITGFTTLPGARTEIENIQEYLEGVCFFDTLATKSNFLKNCSDFEILHLALHTEINDFDPLYSKLFFTSEGVNAFDSLFAYEIYEYPMNARLLVLSGCNTGAGIIEFGEGIMNLARIFIYNGVENIIVTKWSVADKSSASLMDYFYKHLLKYEPVDIALQKAEISFIKFQDPLKTHPYYWAGYTSVGMPVVYKPFNWILLISFVVIVILCVRLGHKVIKNQRKNVK